MEQKDTPITEAYHTLCSKRLHSIPILDGQNPISFLDLSDITSHLLSSFSNDDFRHIPHLSQWRGEYIRVLNEKQKIWDVIEDKEVPDPRKVAHFRSKTASEVATHPFVTLQSSDNLHRASEVFTSQSGVNRLAIVDQNSGRMMAIVTSTDVVRFLQSQLSRFGVARGFKVADMNLDVPKRVVCISEDATALEAFRLMHNEKVSGLAVVDRDNRVVGAISPSDMKEIHFDGGEFISLYLPVSEFIGKSRKGDATVPSRDISVTSSSTLEEVINNFANHRVHRLFVVDSNHHPVGVISISDLLKTTLQSNL